MTHGVALLLRVLLSVRAQLTDKRFDALLTQALLEHLYPALTVDDARDLGRRLRVFAGSDRRQALAENLNCAWPPHVRQPEALLVFMLLDDDPFALADAWSRAQLEWQALEELADVWATPIIRPR